MVSVCFQVDFQLYVTYDLTSFRHNGSDGLVCIFTFTISLELVGNQLENVKIQIEYELGKL